MARCSGGNTKDFPSTTLLVTGIHQPELREHHLYRALPQAPAQVPVHTAAREPQVGPRLQAQHHFSGLHSFGTNLLGKSPPPPILVASLRELGGADEKGKAAK